MEFLTGSLFVWWYVVGFTFFKLTTQPFTFVQPLFWLTVALLFVVIFFADLSYYIIPDSAVFLLTLLALSYRIFLTTRGVMQSSDFWASIASGVGASAFFLALFLLTKGRGMGFGDVKLAFPLGLLLGFPLIIVGTFSSFIIGALIGLLLIVVGKKKVKGIVPFGPFLILGTIVALVWGEAIIPWYVSLL